MDLGTSITIYIVSHHHQSPSPQQPAALPSPLILEWSEPLWLIPVPVFIALASLCLIIWNGTGPVAVGSCQIPDINKTNYIILKSKVEVK